MADILGMDGETALLLAAGLLFFLWWVARSPRLVHGDAVQMNIFCLHCNRESRVARSAQRCKGCGSRSVSVLRV